MATVMPKTLHALHRTHETELLLYTLLLHPRVNINNRKYTQSMGEMSVCYFKENSFTFS